MKECEVDDPHIELMKCCFILGLQTIIECLKNACTGELPPNARSGQTFIHDPKVCS